MKERYTFDNFSAGMKLATLAAFTFLAGIGGKGIWMASAQSERLDSVIRTVQQHDQQIKDTISIKTDVEVIKNDISYIKKYIDELRPD